MKFDLEEKLTSGDLDFGFRNSLVEETKARIKDNPKLMAEIKEVCEEENKDEVDGRLSNKDYMDLRIDEMAQDAVDRIRLYADFEIEVKL